MNSMRVSDSGFTLSELLIVVAIAGILAAIAVPSFTSLSQSQRVRSASFDFYSMLSLARSEAIKSNASVAVAFVMAGSTLSRIDATSSGGVLLYTKSAPKGVVIIPSANAVTGITYQRNGRTTVTTTPTFQIDVENATVSTPTTHVRCITVGLSGMPGTRKGAC